MFVNAQIFQDVVPLQDTAFLKARFCCGRFFNNFPWAPIAFYSSTYKNFSAVRVNPSIISIATIITIHAIPYHIVVTSRPFGSAPPQQGHVIGVNTGSSSAIAIGTKSTVIAKTIKTQSNRFILFFPPIVYFFPRQNPFALSILCNTTTHKLQKLQKKNEISETQSIFWKF